MALAVGYATQAPTPEPEPGQEPEPAPPIVLRTYTHDWAIDELGPVQTLPGTYDEDGVELTPPTYDNRHHVNFQGVAPEEWDTYLVVVNSPSRIWAGQDGAVPTQDILDQIQ